jgi:RNA polymerase sigma-70 factor (ECF subfamily)
MAFAGEIEDFGAFYERTYPVAYRTAWAILREGTAAADAVQDAYVSAYRDRGRFRGEAPARAWLLRIVVNRCLANVRRRPQPRLVALDEGIDPADPGDDPARLTDHLALDEAMRALDARSRAAVVLRYYADMDHAAIGEALGTNANHVGVILHRALERLQREMRREDGLVVELREVRRG